MLAQGIRDDFVSRSFGESEPLQGSKPTKSIGSYLRSFAYPLFENANAFLSAWKLQLFVAVIFELRPLYNYMSLLYPFPIPNDLSSMLNNPDVTIKSLNKFTRYVSCMGRYLGSVLSECEGQI